MKFRMFNRWALAALFACALGAPYSLAADQAPPPADANSGVTLNFPGVDVHQAAKAILGDILGLNYSVDPAVQANVTVETAEPVSKEDVLPVLEEALKAANLALVRRGDVYTIVPLAEAKRQPQLVSASDAGYGTEAIPLHFVNAIELKKLLDPLVPDNAISQADAGRSLLMVTGTASERRSFRKLVQQFDVNWLHGMSFDMFVPKRADSKVVMPELDAMLNAPGAPTAGLVRLIAVDRLNGILAISAQPQYLREVKRMIDMLDREGEGSERRLFVYRVQNGRASDLAAVLVNAFGGNSAAPNAQKPETHAAASSAQTQAASTYSFNGNSSGSTGTTDIIDNSATPGAPTAPIPAQTLYLGGTNAPVTISCDDNNNAIVVFSTPREFAIVEEALHKLDILPLQVLIEAAITEVTLNKDLQYGVQWQFKLGSGMVALSQGTTATPTQIFPGFSYLVHGGDDITATLNALQSVTTIKVISAPKLMVLNNHTAALQVGDEVPIATASAVSTDNPGAPIVNSIDYKDTGVILKVTPRVNDGGLVLLDISQEVSDVANTDTSTIDSPTIEERRISSSVAVKDGQTIALGGLIRDNATVTRGGVPFLSQIPVLGSLFGTTDDGDKRTELIVLLTPRVVRNSGEAQSVTDELLSKIHAAEPLPAASK